MSKSTREPFKLSIDVKINIVTAENAARLLQTIIQVLLYQRVQIPFTYELFSNFVKKLPREDVNGDSQLAVKNFRIAKQQTEARNTVHAIQSIYNNTVLVLGQHAEVAEARILFGATIYTAKECFSVQLPKVDPDHYDQHHRSDVEAVIKNLVMYLTLTREIHDSPRVQAPTNVFILFKCRNSGEEDGQLLQRLQDYRIPTGCERYVIVLQHTRVGNAEENCCKNLSIYQDDHLSNGEHNGSANSANRSTQSDESSLCWYLLNVPLRGFKATAVGGKYFWE